MTTEKKTMKVVVVGGGPAGACAAKAMADRGYTNVHLYEAYPPPKSLSKTSSKAYLIALNPRGIRGIRETAGIDVLSEAANGPETTGSGETQQQQQQQEQQPKRGVASYDIARHDHNPKTDTTSTTVMNHGDHPQCLIPRKALVERLLEGAHASGVTVHYEHRLEGIDFSGKAATFSRASGKDENNNDDDDDGVFVVVGYDLLLGADGSHSTVRNLMVGAEERHTGSLGGFHVRIAEDNMQYQVAVLPSNPFAVSAGGGGAGGGAHPAGTMESWNHRGRNAICLGLPTTPETTAQLLECDETDVDRKTGGIMLCIVFPEGELESFRTERDGHEKPLSDLLPDLSRDDRAIVAGQLRSNRIGHGGLCVWPSDLGHGPSGVILLGDAAHGMWPSLGQGANCALETVGVFVRCLDGMTGVDGDGDGDGGVEAWTTRLLENFREARLEDVTAAVDLTYGGIGARRSRGRENAPLSAKIRLVTMILLSKLTGGFVPMPALLRILGGHTDLSYSDAKRWHFHREPLICNLLLPLLLLPLPGLFVFAAATPGGDRILG